MILTDLRELKTILEIDPDDVQEDTKLNLLIEQAAEWIGEIINRPNLLYKLRTEYYDGNGTNRLLLNARPVFPATMSIWEDEYGNFGSTSGAFSSNTALVYGEDFALQIDDENGLSRSGIVFRIKDVWPISWTRGRGLLAPYPVQCQGCIKVQYGAGYTIDTLPSVFRTACNTLVAKMRSFYPLGMQVTSEGYEELSMSFSEDQKSYLTGLVKGLVFPYRNYAFGR